MNINTSYTMSTISDYIKYRLQQVREEVILELINTAEEEGCEDLLPLLNKIEGLMCV